MKKKSDDIDSTGLLKKGSIWILSRTEILKETCLHFYWSETYNIWLFVKQKLSFLCNLYLLYLSVEKNFIVYCIFRIARKAAFSLKIHFIYILQQLLTIAMDKYFYNFIIYLVSYYSVLILLIRIEGWLK